MILKLVSGYHNFLILGQSHQTHKFRPNTTDHTFTYRTLIGRISHYSLSVHHNEYRTGPHFYSLSTTEQVYSLSTTMTTEQFHSSTVCSHIMTIEQVHSSIV